MMRRDEGFDAHWAREPGEAGRLRALLLHRLPPAQAEMLRQRVLLDEEFAARVREQEYALLDDYAAGRLDAAERRAVERHLLATPQDRLRLRIARALQRRRRRSYRSLARWAWIPPAVAAAVLLTVVGVRGFGALGSASAPTTTVTLLARAERGASAGVLRIAPHAGRVRLQAEVVDPPAGARYRLEIRDRYGRRRYVVDDLAARHVGAYAYVEATVPAAALAPGRHRIRVSGPGFDFTWSERVASR